MMLADTIDRVGFEGCTQNFGRVKEFYRQKKEG